MRRLWSSSHGSSKSTPTHKSRSRTHSHSHSHSNSHSHSGSHSHSHSRSQSQSGSISSLSPVRADRTAHAAPSAPGDGNATAGRETTPATSRRGAPSAPAPSPTNSPTLPPAIQLVRLPDLTTTPAPSPPTPPSPRVQRSTASGAYTGDVSVISGDVVRIAEKARRVELIVKLGGSALTVKTRPHTVHTRHFDAAMDTVARVHGAGVGCIVVHGAGSFGHFEAKRCGVADGDASPLGVSSTHAAVVRLNGLVIDALVSRQVPAVGVAPLVVPAKIRVDFVAALLDRGHVPVLHGDACYAGDGRTAVLSGDALVASLAGAFEFVDRVVFLSDVPGVLCRPPESYADVESEQIVAQQLIRRVTVNEVGEMRFGSEVETSVLGHDVSGGITGKVAAAGKCVSDTDGRVTGFIAKVGSQSAEDALLGKAEKWGTVNCTCICYEMEGVALPVAGDGGGGRSDGGMGRRRWFGQGGST